MIRLGAGSVLAVAALAGASPTAGARTAHRPGPAHPPTTRMVVSVGGGGGHRPLVPRDFLGLSFEIKYARAIGELARRGNLVTLLRSLGRGVIRLGGVTADTQVAWTNDQSIPPWATTAMTRGDLEALGQLVRRAGWKALLTVNLGHSDAQAAAQEAAAAATALGPSLAGIELGNEPDAYVSPDNLRTAPWAFPQYQAEVDSYRAAIAAAAPGVRIAGPDAAHGRSKIDNWMIPEARAEHPTLLTEHYYSYGCAEGPTTSDLLRPSVRRAETAMFARMQRVSVGSRIPLRADETNNVSCGGIANVSDTLAASLWAVDFLTRAMSAGLAGINFHDVITTAHGYSPLVATSPSALAAGRLAARPEWYALLMARALVGDRPLPVKVMPTGLNVAVSAFSGPASDQVVIVDDQAPGSRPLSVRLSLPRRPTSGTVLRLIGPSPTATGAVTLGGSSVSTSGSWQPARPLPTVTREAGGVRLTVAPSSAALITLPMRATRR